MTHGWLDITDMEHTCSLHTWHTGQDIGYAVSGVFRVVATKLLPLASVLLKQGDEVANVANRVLQASTDCNSLLYPPTAAAAIIATHPLFLEPVFPEWDNTLPSWCGRDTPNELRISPEGGTWLYREYGEPAVGYNVRAAVLAELIKQLEEIQCNSKN